MMKLTSENVDKVFCDCLYGECDGRQEALLKGKLVKGVMLNVAFNHEKVENHLQNIKDMLAQLPLAFRKEDGGGWSFLQMCNDAEGNQWTGEQKQMDALVCLGLAIDELRFCLPREMWKVFPDGMPYVQIF